MYFVLSFIYVSNFLSWEILFHLFSPIKGLVPIYFRIGLTYISLICSFNNVRNYNNRSCIYFLNNKLLCFYFPGFTWCRKGRTSCLASFTTETNIQESIWIQCWHHTKWKSIHPLLDCSITRMLANLWPHFFWWWCGMYVVTKSKKKKKKTNLGF